MAGGLQDIGTKALQITGAALAGASAAVAGFATAALGEFGTFQTGMQEVFTLLPGITEDAMRQMESSIQAFGERTGRLTEETIPALYQALSAGVPQENVFAFLEVANKAAVAGVTDLETAVDGMTTIINAYGLEMSDATSVSDALFTAVRLGKTTFAELSDSMFQLAPIASAMGASFDEALAAVTAITTQGVPTSVAMTQVRQALVELGDSGTEVGKTFQELSGQTFQEFLNSGNSLADAFALLEQGALDAGIPISQMFGSVEAGQAALALTGANMDTFTNVIDEMGNAAGATDAAFATMNQGIGVALNKLGSSWESLLISMGRIIEPFVTPVINAFTRLVQAFTGVLDGGDALAQWESDFAFLGPLQDVFLGLAQFIYDFSAAFGSMVAAIQAGVPPLDAFQNFLYTIAGAGAAEAFEDMVYWVGEFGRVAQEILGPIIDWISQHVELQDVLMALGIAIATVVVPAVLGFFAAFAPLTILIGTIALLRTAWEENWGGIQEKTAAIVDWLTNTGWPALSGFFSQIADAWDNIVWPGLQAFWDWFMATGLPAIIDYFSNTFLTPLMAGFALIATLWEIVSPAFTSFYNWFMTDGLAAIMDWIDAEIIPRWELFTALMSGLWEVVSASFGSFFNWFMTDGLAAIMDFIDTEITPRWELFQDLLAGIWEMVRPGFQAFGDGVIAILQGIADAILGAQESFTAFQNTVSGAQAGYSFAGQASGQIAGGLASGQYSVGDVLGAFGNALFGGNQFGGYVKQGVPSWVGEGGRELFVPSSDGQIVNHRDSELAAQGGGGSGTQIIINVYGAISDEQANESVYKLKRELSAQGITL